MPPIREILRASARLPSSRTLSPGWGSAYKALAAAAVVLLFGAVCQRLGHDDKGALTLFVLGLSTQIGATICFFVALRACRKR